MTEVQFGKVNLPVPVFLRQYQRNWSTGGSDPRAGLLCLKLSGRSYCSAFRSLELR